jgi:wyosine [tRNA(Phe)-imidazoG37] synthetase (radical SAM superfamily)
MRDVIDQLKARLPEEPHLDYITFSGSGEPTLNADIGTIISAIKEVTSIPVAVLTNGSLLWDTQVQADLMRADLVVPSLDAATSEMFEYINRPHQELDFERILGGLIEFRQRFRGQIWLEIFLLEGVNTTKEELLEMKRHVEAMRPDRIQLNTVARPPAEESALKVPYEHMMRIQAFFGEHAEVIAPYGEHSMKRRIAAKTEEVLALLRRRPCTVEDIASGLSIHLNEAIKHLAILEKQKALHTFKREDKQYYQALE